jgi:hypothetical protein
MYKGFLKQPDAAHVSETTFRRHRCGILRDLGLKESIRGYRC